VLEVHGYRISYKLPVPLNLQLSLAYKEPKDTSQLLKVT